MKVQKLKDGRLRNAGTGRVLKDALSSDDILKGLNKVNNTLKVAESLLSRDKKNFLNKMSVSSAQDMITYARGYIGHYSFRNAKSSLDRAIESLKESIVNMKKTDGDNKVERIISQAIKSIKKYLMEISKLQ